MHNHPVRLPLRCLRYLQSLWAVGASNSVEVHPKQVPCFLDELSKDQFLSLTKRTPLFRQSMRLKERKSEQVVNHYDRFSQTYCQQGFLLQEVPGEQNEEQSLRSSSSISPLNSDGSEQPAAWKKTCLSHWNLLPPRGDPCGMLRACVWIVPRPSRVAKVFPLLSL